MKLNLAQVTDYCLMLRQNALWQNKVWLPACIKCYQNPNQIFKMTVLLKMIHIGVTMTLHEDTNRHLLCVMIPEGKPEYLV